MLPFTRMLAGRMDYTPGGFDNVTRDEFVPRSPHAMVMGTRAQQLAMYAVYEAPFQMVSDTPKAYEDQPAFEFIKHCPTTWDVTKVLIVLLLAGHTRLGRDQRIANTFTVWGARPTSALEGRSNLKI